MAEKECIERMKAQDGLDNIDWYHVNDKGQLLPGGKSDIETYVPFKAVEEMLKTIPAADVRPVVLCRDCKYWKQWDNTTHYLCTYVAGAKFIRNADDFCSRGEKGES